MGRQVGNGGFMMEKADGNQLDKVVKVNITSDGKSYH